MSKISKRDIILQEIIRAYLEENLPIGSSLLNARIKSANIQIPASTIRVYFKKLSEEGILTQLHISGGRIPTNEAMKEYWLNHLNMVEPIYITDQETFGQIVDDFGLYCIINAHTEDTLDEIIRVDDRFLLLILGKEQIVLNFNEKVARFLEEIKGVKLSELKHISLQLGLHELNEKLEYLIATKVLFKKGEKTLFEMADSNNLSFNFIVDANFPKSLNDGLIFDDILPSGYMAIKTPAVFKGEESHLFCLGELYKDFESFFIKTKENA